MQSELHKLHPVADRGAEPTHQSVLRSYSFTYTQLQHETTKLNVSNNVLFQLCLYFTPYHNTKIHFLVSTCAVPLLFLEAVYGLAALDNE